MEWAWVDLDKRMLVIPVKSMKSFKQKKLLESSTPSR